MKFTFGKYNGWDTNDLAKAGPEGRGYLAWAADNLKSPMWRAECERALRQNDEADDDLEAQAIATANSDIDIYEARYIVAGRREDEHRYNAFFSAVEAAQSEVIAKYMAITGNEEAAMRRAIRQVEEYADVYGEMPPVNRFSSPERRQQMAAMLGEWKACYDVADL